MKDKKISLLFVSILFFLSGFSGLVLQVIWTRKIALVFGNTIYSASTTVAAFMFGLGLGAYLSGKYLMKYKNHITIYAIMELSVGISAFIITTIIPSVSTSVIFISNYFPGYGAITTILKFSIILFILLIPCTAMGTTLPILTEFFSRGKKKFGDVLSTLYAINTLGAAAGAFLSDFILVKQFGVIETAFIGATVNIIVAITVFFLVGNNYYEKEEIKYSPYRKDIIYLIFTATGFCSIAYEIICIRILIFFNGADIFVFSSILTTFLTGIVIGSFLLKFFKTSYHKEILLSIILTITGVIIFLNIFSTGWLHPARSFIFNVINIPYPYDQFLTNSLFILPVTILFGITFPLASIILHEKIQYSGKAVGMAYILNTSGSIAGSLAAGFIFLPLLGSQWSLTLISSIMIASVAVYLFFNKKYKIFTAGVCVLLVSLIIISCFIPSTTLRDNIFYLYKNDLQNIIYDDEDKYGWVTLIKQWSPEDYDYTVNLLTDGFNMAGDNFNTRRYARSLSIAPILLHKNPEDVLVIAMGLTNTLYGAQTMGSTKHIDCVELNDTVPDIIKRLPIPTEALRSPKVNVIINDGRNYLLTGNKKYDIITAEPPPPINAGIVNLYSEEYYILCRNHLKPGGIVTQWLPVMQMSSFEAQTIIKAFQNIFPFTYLCDGGCLNLCLLGSQEELIIDYPALKDKIKKNNKILKTIGMESPELFVAHFIKGPDTLNEYCLSIPPLTDEHPYIQYTTGDWNPDIKFYFFTDDNKTISVNTGKGKEKILNETEINRGLTVNKYLYNYQWLNGNSRYETIIMKTIQAREILKNYPHNNYFLVTTKATDKAINFYKKEISNSPSNPSIFFELARINYYRGNTEDAITFINQAISLSENNKENNDKSFYELYKGLIMEEYKNTEDAVNSYKNCIKYINIKEDFLKKFAEEKIRHVTSKR